MAHELNPQRGQSLVFFAILSVAGLIFLALIIDGGGAYAMRRLAQNAADAGALAGAREYCMTGESSTAIQAANQYATQNNLARLGNVDNQTANVIIDDVYVDVQVSIVYDTFFARILGMDQMTAVAEAEAGCFAPSAGEGVIPVAWECRDVYGGDFWESDCEIDFMNGPDDPYDYDCDLGEDTVFLFIDSPDAYSCDHWPDEDNEDTVVVNCGQKTDGTPLVELVNPYHPTHGWMWVDLDGGNANAADYADWVKGINVPDIEVHTWLYGSSGTIESTYGWINTYHAGDQVVIPVFDDRCVTDDPEVRCWNPVTDSWIDRPPPSGIEDWWHAQDQKRLINAGGVEKVPYYHLTSFALLDLNCVDAQGNKNCAARDWIEDNNKFLKWSQVSSFEGCFRQGFHPGVVGQETNGTFVGAWTIYLIK